MLGFTAISGVGDAGQAVRRTTVPKSFQDWRIQAILHTNFHPAIHILNRKPIPFHFEVNHGFAEAKGLLHINKNGLTLEFEVKDAFGGFIKSDLKEVDISFKDIEDLTYKKGFLGATVIIEGNSMRTFEDIPGAEQGRCELKIKRKDRDQAERSVSSARVALSEHKLNELE